MRVSETEPKRQHHWAVEIPRERDRVFDRRPTGHARVMWLAFGAVNLVLLLRNVPLTYTLD
jgi:hypothetical protein